MSGNNTTGTTATYSWPIPPNCKYKQRCTRYNTIWCNGCRHNKNNKHDYYDPADDWYWPYYPPWTTTTITYSWGSDMNDWYTHNPP